MSTADLSTSELFEALKAQGVTQKEIALSLGIAQSAVSNIITGRRQLKYEEAMRLRKLLKGMTRQTAFEIPIIGMSGAGRWVEAVEQSDSSITLPAHIGGEDTKASFAVEVLGDSMDILMPEGTFAVIDTSQTELFSGRTYLLMNPDGEATIKRYRSDPARFEPVSNNPDYQPFTVGTTDFRVIGRVTLALQKF